MPQKWRRGGVEMMCVGVADHLSIKLDVDPCVMMVNIKAWGSISKAHKISWKKRKTVKSTPHCVNDRSKSDKGAGPLLVLKIIRKGVKYEHTLYIQCSRLQFLLTKPSSWSLSHQETFEGVQILPSENLTNFLVSRKIKTMWAYLICSRPATCCPLPPPTSLDFGPSSF